MRNCPYCKIEVGGTSTKCPFCQSALSGQAEVDFWPSPNNLHTQSVLYKLQLFLVLSGMIIGLALDFLLEKNTGLHWSLLLAMWLLAAEFGLFRLFKKSFSLARIITLFVLTLAVLLSITSYFAGAYYWGLMMKYVIPLMIIGTMIVNFVITIVDDISNAMVYLLCNILIGIVPYIVMMIMGKNITHLWIICLIVSVITFLGACIFRGRSVVGELQKRFNM